MVKIRRLLIVVGRCWIPQDSPFLFGEVPPEKAGGINENIYSICSHLQKDKTAFFLIYYLHGDILQVFYLFGDNMG
jgi:hypothetical protein